MVLGMSVMFLRRIGADGVRFSSYSGPHVDAWNPWPMSHISAIYGTDDDNEILNSLYTIANVSCSVTES